MSFEASLTPRLKVPSLAPKLSNTTALKEAPAVRPALAKPVAPAALRPPGGLSRPMPSATLRPPGLKIPVLGKKPEAPKMETEVVVFPAEEIAEAAVAAAEEQAIVMEAVPAVEAEPELIAADAPAETTESAVETAKEPEEVKKPEPRKKGSKTKTASNEPIATAPALAEAVKGLLETVSIEIPSSTCSLAAAIGLLYPIDVTEMWDDDFCKQVEEKMAEIVITEDVNPSAVRVMESKIDMLYSMIRLEYSRVKGLMENFSKGDSYIDRIKAANTAGTNAEERRRNAILGVMKYKAGNEEINVYEIADRLRQQHLYLQGIMDQLNFKREILITVGGTLRTESTL